MGIISTILGSVVIMWLVAFVCAVFCIRCVIRCFTGGTSTLLRIFAAIVFGFITYYCWQYANTLGGANAIDRFVFDSWADCKQFFGFIKSKI